MFLVRDFSKENIRKDQPVYQTLRACTSEKRILVCPPANQFIRVGAYKYRQQDLLGKGFSSKVYKASHINNPDERYAIKVINLKKFKASNIAMLQSQIEVHRTLSHPNIVQFYDAYKTENFYYIITQYCPHGDLMEMINNRKKIQESKAQSIIQQIIQGYVYLCKRFVLHRDLKPANIFRNGELWKIGDFGFSIVCRTQCFFDKINVGTPLYMPPQALKTNKYSFKSDIFALGIMLFEMIVGRTPWQCKTEKQLVSKMKNQPIKIPQLKSQDIRRFIAKACEIEQNERLSVNQIINFFNPACSSTNPQQKQNQKKTLKNMLSMKNLKEITKIPMTEAPRNISINLINKQITSNPSNAYQPSTEVSEKSDSYRIKQRQSIFQKNTKLLLQQLQYCRLMYYMTKNIKYFPIHDPKTKGFLSLTLFKHLLRLIKVLEDPALNYRSQMNQFDEYQNQKEYKKILEQIKSYSRRYEKQYLDVLKNTQISVIRAVNKRFPELSYNSALGEHFYMSFYRYISETLRLLNHDASANENCETDRQLLAASYQSVESLYAYCLGVEQKMKASEAKKNEIFVNFNYKVVMDYRQSKLEKKDYQQLRQKLRNV